MWTLRCFPSITFILSLLSSIIYCIYFILYIFYFIWLVSTYCDFLSLSLFLDLKLNSITTKTKAISILVLYVSLSLKLSLQSFRQIAFGWPRAESRERARPRRDCFACLSSFSSHSYIHAPIHPPLLMKYSYKIKIEKIIHFINTCN